MKLSPTMQKLVAFMREHGNEIHRHPGGFWSRKDFTVHRDKWFGSSSVEALVDRGVAEYVERQKGRSGGEFPIRARLAPAHTSEQGEKP